MRNKIVKQLRKLSGDVGVTGYNVINRKLVRYGDMQVQQGTLVMNKDSGRLLYKRIKGNYRRLLKGE